MNHKSLQRFISSTFTLRLFDLLLLILFTPSSSYSQEDAVAAVCSDDGRLEIFYQVNDPEGGIYHTFQIKPKLLEKNHPATPSLDTRHLPPTTEKQTSLSFMDKWEWTPWERLLPAPDKGNNVVAARDNNGRLIVCWISGGSIWYAAQPSTNTSFAPPVKTDTWDLHTLRLTKNQDGRIEMYSLSSSGEVRSIYQTDANNWTFDLMNLGQAAVRIIDIYPSSFLDGRLAIVGLGEDHQIYWRSQHQPNGSWVDWSSLGGTDIQAVAAGSNAAGKLFVLAVGGDGSIYEKRQQLQSANNTNTWYDWRKIQEGPYIGPINVGRNEDGRLEAIFFDKNKMPIHTWQKSATTGSWDADHAFFPYESIATNAAFTTTLDKRLVITFCRGYYNGTRHTSYATVQRQTGPNINWYSTQAPPVIFPEPPVPPAQPSIEIDKFEVKPDLGVYPGQNFTIYWNFHSRAISGPIRLLITKKYSGEPEVVLKDLTNPPNSGSFEAPSGPSGFPEFKLIVQMVDNIAIADDETVGSHVQPAMPGHVPTASLFVGPAQTDPAILHENLPFKISYLFANLGDKDQDEFEVTLSIDGTVEGTAKSVPELGPNKSITLTWDVSKMLTKFVHQFEVKRKSDGAVLNFSQLTVEP